MSMTKKTFVGLIILCAFIFLFGGIIWFNFRTFFPQESSISQPAKEVPSSNTPLPSHTAPQNFIRVLDQREGNVFSLGGTMRIEWEGNGPEFVDIYLKQEGTDIRYKIGQAKIYNSFPETKDQAIKQGAFTYTAGEKLQSYGRAINDTQVKPGTYKVKVTGQIVAKDATGKDIPPVQIEGISSGLIFIQKGGDASLTPMKCPFGLRSGSCATSDQYVRLVAPNGKETFCLGKEMQIKWQHKGMRTVNLTLREAGFFSDKIGVYPADFNESGTVGEGTLVWKIDTQMKEGFAYEITVTSTSGEPIGYVFSDTSDDVFSILKCEG